MRPSADGSAGLLLERCEPPSGLLIRPEQQELLLRNANLSDRVTLREILVELVFQSHERVAFRLSAR